VVGCLLHHDVARLEMNFAVVEQHIDFAGNDNRIRAFCTIPD
jgi:hypothetical protein